MHDATRPGPLVAARDAIRRIKRGLKRAKPRTSYAQYAEDLVICDILGAFKRDAKPGVYVDVGANEPKRFSNTWRLYELGWSGIAVEPDRDLCRRFARVRSRDAVVCAALGEREEDLVFHRFYESALNTLDPAMAARAESQGWPMMSREPLRLRTLNSVLEEHAARVRGGIDLLSIDAEGLDAAILRGLDFKRFQPKLIVFEVQPDAAPGKGESSELLASHGYALRARLFNSEMWMR